MKTSKKTIKDFYKESLLEDPYKDPNFSDINSESDPQAYVEAIKETKDAKNQKKAFFDRLLQKINRGE